MLCAKVRACLPTATRNGGQEVREAWTWVAVAHSRNEQSALPLRQRCREHTQCRAHQHRIGREVDVTNPQTQHSPPGGSR